MKAKLLLVLLGLAISQLSLATSNEKSSKGVIKRLITYANYGNGDVFVSLPTNGSTCSYGYFLSKNSNGYESTLSSLLAAYQAQTAIYIYGLTSEDKRWSGSGNHVCEIYSVEYHR